jgi:hypothetical protein
MRGNDKKAKMQKMFNNGMKAGLCSVTCDVGGSEDI